MTLRHEVLETDKLLAGQEPQAGQGGDVGEEWEDYKVCP